MIRTPTRLRPRSGGGPLRPFSPTAATTAPTKPATSPTRLVTHHGVRSAGRLAADRVVRKAAASDDPAMEPRHALLTGARR